VITTTRTVHASPAEVWDVLADGWLYPVWVVGASRMREVADEWPGDGSRLHHSLGVWPVLVNDDTEVVESRPHSLLSLRGRGWPFGEVSVVIRLRPVGAETEVVIEEDVVAGPGRFVPRPLRAVGLRWRNVETLRRLAYIAERRTTASATGARATSDNRETP
jgi:uncharacterized protein YndB with AHSA1/START domain